MSLKLLFPLLMSLLFAAIHYLAFSRVVRRLHVSRQSERALRFFLIFNFAGIVLYIVSRYFHHFPEWLHYLVSLSVGVGFVLFVSWLLYELVHLLQRALPLDPKRRNLFKRGSDLAFLAAGSAYIGGATLEGAKAPSVVALTVDQGRFQHPIRIVQISDMHIGGLIDADFVRQSVETINALSPDLVVITGDLTDAPIEELREAVDALRLLRSRLGTFYVPGNHEYFHGVEATMAHLRSLGITVLGNVHVDLGDFVICGVYDVFGWRYGSFAPDIRAATQNLPDKPTLLLAHQPRFIASLEGFEPSLMLCGHTHGGQIWPFNYLVRLQQPYVKGLHGTGENRHIYVNSGIGFWGPPMRLGSSAEITLLEWT
ncbi:MAG: metallophosphoesterase [Campylobacterales bacterium]|nr:metallophosphoesterase [Campylobacterales bacterium]